ncbi:MAG: helix-turn-helix transcriptional regulator [Blastocatellia bacterium]
MMKLTVKEIAEARGFKNAKQLADTAGIRYKSMYPIWNGAARMIGLDTLERLCNTLRVQAGMLFEIVPDDEPLESEPSQSVAVKADKPRRTASPKSKRESKRARVAVTSV